MSTRPGKTKMGRERLLAYWEPPDEAGEPIGCVATSFTFDAAFFEEECLARFAGIEGDPLEDTRGYLVEREEKLSQLFACVLVDRHNVARNRSLRWNLLPVRPPGSGILHAKIALLVWENRIRVLVTSANLTEPAYRRNYEVAGLLDFHAGSELPRSLLIEVIDFLGEVATMAPGGGAPAEDGPTNGLSRFLGDARGRASRLPKGGFRSGVPQLHFVTTGPGRPELFSRARELFGSPGPEFAQVMSPFYDEGDGAKLLVDRMLGFIAVKGERSISFVAPGREHAPPEKLVEIDLPECLRKPWAKRLAHTFSWVSLHDSEGEQRPLHAKSLWFKRKDRVLFVLGSSNFTLAGTGNAGPNSNLEANLAYVIPDVTDPFGAACSEVIPPCTEVDPEERTILFRQSPPRTEEAAGLHLLPQGFGLALFRPEGGLGEIDLEILAGAPATFRILTESGTPLLSSEAWRAVGAPQHSNHPWKEPRPPSHLEVHWTTESGDAASAPWVVNVSDASKLPPPDELRNLNLHELLEVLTSTRPLFDAVNVILRRKEAAPTGHGVDIDLLDPHARVDQRNFLIRRMRRIAAALEGLRERLERPAYTLESLRWRLTGPVGPVVLATKLADQEKEAAAFFIAEVFLTLRQIDRARLGAHLGKEVVAEELDRVAADLKTLIVEEPEQPSLARYVKGIIEGNAA